MFIREHFQFNRGVPNCQATGEGLTTVQHTYISATDSVADISSLDYFPDYFHEDPSFVIPKDTLLIIGSDAVVMVEILTAAPVTLGTNLFVDSGPSLEIDPPIAATDANGIVLNGQVLTLEYADATHPGILSIVAQTIGGPKSFPGNILTNKVDTITAVPLELGTTTASSVTIAKNNSTSLVSGITVKSTTNVPANVGLRYQVSGLEIINGANVLTLDGANNFNCPATFNVNTIKRLTTPGTLSINDQADGITSVSTFIFNRSEGIQFPAGSGGGQILNLKNDIAVPIAWTGPWATNSNGTVNILRINNIVILTISGVAPRAANHGAIISTTEIPSYAWPVSSSISAQVIAVSGGANYYGSCTLTSAGTLSIYTDIADGGFSGLGLAGFYGFPLIFNIDNP